MKIDKIDIVLTENVSRESFPYVKPTDYYSNYLSSLHPHQAAFMDRVCCIRMKLDNGISLMMETSDSVCSFIVSSNIPSLIKGLSVSSINMIWDLLYRYTIPIGRAGIVMHVLIIINLLMYDAYTKSLGIPVYEPLGRKTRDKIRTHASHLHPTSKEELEKGARSYVEEGYIAMKMRFCCGLSDPLGFHKNTELVKTIRDSVGYFVDLAGDAWMSWNLNFALNMAKRFIAFCPNLSPKGFAVSAPIPATIEFEFRAAIILDNRGVR